MFLLEVVADRYLDLGGVLQTTTPGLDAPRIKSEMLVVLLAFVVSAGGGNQCLGERHRVR